LESGQVLYKAVDFGYDPDHVANCIHAVASIVRGNRLRIPSTAFGEPAAYLLARRMRPWFVDGACTHDWVARRLGLDHYPLRRRGLDAPPCGWLRATLCGR
jgi:hypothetical protein